MCLRFMFLLTTRLAAWLRLARREETWKTAEILILRHQLAVLQRQQPRRPKLNWADRALLATLLAVMPKATGPPGPCEASRAGQPSAGTSGPWSSGWPARTDGRVSRYHGRP